MTPAKFAPDFECGAGIANFNDVKVGDILECFQVTKVTAAEAAARATQHRCNIAQISCGKLQGKRRRLAAR